jgi:hypothetical protein
METLQWKLLMLLIYTNSKIFFIKNTSTTRIEWNVSGFETNHQIQTVKNIYGNSAFFYDSYKWTNLNSFMETMTITHLGLCWTQNGKVENLASMTESKTLSTLPFTMSMSKQLGEWKIKNKKKL